MDEYIIKKEAIKAVGHTDIIEPSISNEFFESLRIRNAAIESIIAIPAEDVVRVVRCKDCVYMKDKHCENEEMNQGMPHCWLMVEPDWYCCHGKQRTD